MMNNPFQLMQMLGNLTQNPMQILSQCGLNVPNNLNNPQEIIQHLLNTGQISQDQVNQAQQMQNNPIFRNLMK